MKRHPISAPAHPYRGNDPRKQEKKREFNERAQRIVDWVNGRVVALGPGTHVIAYDEIGLALDLDYREVADVMVHVDGGHTGVTIQFEDRW